MCDYCVCPSFLSSNLEVILKDWHLLFSEGQ